MTTRREARAEGDAILAAMLREPWAAQLPEDIRGLLSEVVFRGVWSRPGLARPERMICSLAAMCASQRPAVMRPWVGAALDMGLEPLALQEICLHVGYYVGLVGVEDTLSVVREVCVERRCPLPPVTSAEGTVEDLAVQADRVNAMLHGKGKAPAPAQEAEVVGALFHLAAPYAYGAVWNRPGLDYRARTLVAIAAFTALRMDDQIRLFSRAGLRIGLGRTEVIEAIVQTAPFSGFPAAIQALRLLAKMLAAEADADAGS